ncbi:MAG: hypothetical protein K2K84_04230, partial [Muribaculaceae bacterium]|nr:hypothetical protein [Muribaculaceae bacterium]
MEITTDWDFGLIYQNLFLSLQSKSQSVVILYDYELSGTWRINQEQKEVAQCDPANAGVIGRCGA